MKNIIFSLALLAAFCTAIYGMYWVAKTVSYEIFYKDMVEQTVREMVKPDSLASKAGHE